MPIGDGTSTLSDRDVRRFRKFEFFGFGAPRPKRGKAGASLANLLNPSREIYKIKRRRRGRSHSRQYFTALSRYREKDFDSGTFLKGRKDRKIVANTVLGSLTQWDNGTKQVGLGGKITAGSDGQASLHIQRTWDQTHPGPPFKGGGPFKSIEYHLPASSIQGYGRYTNQGRSGVNPLRFGVYEGGFMDNGVWLGESYDSLKSHTMPPLGSLSAYYTAAWDKTKPSIPKASLAQFAYELKDLPGMLATSANAFHGQWKVLGDVDKFNPLAVGLNGSGRRLRQQQVALPVMGPREVADHFLNHNFGWVPFLSDLSKMFDTINRMSEHIRNTVRDNGVWIKRRRVLEESETVSADAQVGVDSGTIPSSGMRDPDGFPMCRPMTVGGTTQTGICIQKTITRKRVWAAGQFMYYRPEFDMRNFDGSAFDALNVVQQWLTLLGARINPTLVYKVTPWSWLADWFTNFGNYIQRLDDWVQDGIVARGLYVMQTEEKIMTKTCTLNFYSGPVTLQFQRTLSIKQRELADGLYGFNTPWNSLSPKQWAILAAIGASRSNAGYISRGA